MGAADRLFLAADIGGTKTLLALAQPVAGGWQTVAHARFDNCDFTDFPSLLRTFLAMHPPEGLQAVCLAVAGPISGSQARLTNLDWVIDSVAIQACLPAAVRVELINDFAAVGHAIDSLHADDMLSLQAGKLILHAPQCVLGAGTGLGVCYRVWDGQRYRVLPTEAGHIGFAPRSSEQAALLNYWQARLGRVSNELFLSGSGIVRIYEFLAWQAGVETTRVQPVLSGGAAAVSQRALQGEDPLAQRTMQLFCNIYGAVAGDLALAMLTRGGVYVAGGIAGKILPLLQQGEFIQAFNDKTPHAALMQNMPVSIISNPDAGLNGALQCAVHSVTDRL